MPIFNLTAEKIEQAIRQKAEKLKQYEILRNTTAEQIWINDLEVLEKELRDYEAKKRKENLDAITKNQKTVLKNAAKSKTSASKGKRSGVIFLNSLILKKNYFHLMKICKHQNQIKILNNIV